MKAWWLPAALALLLTGCGSDDTEKSCTPGAFANDTCGGRSICMPDGDGSTGKCVEAEACSADEPCSIGTRGAVCSDGIVEREQAVCLVGMCRTAADCPSGMACGSGLLDVGLCKVPGAADAECEVVGDCTEGLTCQPPYRGAPNTVCLDPTPPDDGTCRYDVHCAADEFCAFEAGRCRQGTGDRCSSDDDCRLDSERCDRAEQACVAD